MALADQKLMLAPLPDPGAGIDHFGISFSLQVYTIEKKNFFFQEQMLKF